MERGPESVVERINRNPLPHLPGRGFFVSTANSEVETERARLSVRSVAHVPNDDLPAIGQVADESKTVRRRSLYQVPPEQGARHRASLLRRHRAFAAARHTSQSSQSRHTSQAGRMNSRCRDTVSV